MKFVATWKIRKSTYLLQKKPVDVDEVAEAEEEEAEEAHLIELKGKLLIYKICLF
jgi:hypothetical protein